MLKFIYKLYFFLLSFITKPYFFFLSRFSKSLNNPTNFKWVVDQKVFVQSYNHNRTEAHKKWEIKMAKRFFFFLFVSYYLSDFFLVLSELYFQVSSFKDYFYKLKTQLSTYILNNGFFYFFIFLFFYFFNTLFCSIITFFFGVRGVFFILFYSIFLFWCTQLFFLDFFFFNNGKMAITFNFLDYFAGTAVFSFDLNVDFISYSFLFLTTTIGLCATVYSLSYFKNEPHTDRFMLMLNWFILSMSLLILSDNALLLFLGWELIGLTSFLLINFWTLRRNTLKSAIKAFTFNKVSDVFLLFFIIIVFNYTGTFSITSWTNYFLLKNNNNYIFSIVSSLFLVFASCIKSAQIIGHLWLPDSMEAPIPASALIHSATLVSAGIYLLLRLNFLIQNYYILLLILVIGSITAFYGAIVSAAQTDVKKLLAYSTISHCGFLFITIGINNIYLTITYLYLHGFFKALTFFCVGNLVKVARGYQDTRKMGQFFLVLPVESILLVICAFNLGALPLTVGYFYKSLIQLILLNSKIVVIILPLVFIAMLSSVIYVFRLIFYSLFDIQKSNNINFDIFFNENLNDEEYSNSTNLGIVFIFLLFIISLYVYIFYFLFFKNFIFFNDSFNCQILDLFSVIKITNKNFFYLFYIFFLLISIFLVFTLCRNEFSYLKKNYFFYYIFIFFLFIQIVFCILYFFI